MANYKVTLMLKGKQKVPYVQVCPVDFDKVQSGKRRYSPGYSSRPSGKLYEICLRTGACSSAWSRASMNAPCIPSKKCPHFDECRMDGKDRDKKESFFLELPVNPASRNLGRSLKGMSIDDPVEIAIKLCEAFGETTEDEISLLADKFVGE